MRKWQLLFVNGCDWINHIYAETKYLYSCQYGTNASTFLGLCWKMIAIRRNKELHVRNLICWTFFVISHKSLHLQTQRTYLYWHTSVYGTARSECSPAPLHILLEPHLVRKKFDLTIACTILQCSMTECRCVSGYSRLYFQVIRRVCHSEDT